MTPRQRVALGLLLTGGLLLAWSSAQPDAPPPTASPAPTAPPTTVPSPPAVTSAVPPEPPATTSAPSDTAAPVERPDTPLAAAQDAAFPGWHPVRCPLPAWLAADDGAIAELHFLPPHPGAAGLMGLSVDDGALVAVAAHPQGQGLLQRDLAVVAEVHWEGPRNADGERACSLSPPALLTVSGTVTTTDGAPAPGLLVRVCDPATLVETDAAGRFDARVPGERDCRLLAARAGPDGFGVGPAVVVPLDDADVHDLQLLAPDQLRSPEAQLDWLAAQARAASELQQAAALAPTGLQRALARPDLPAQARPLVETWAAAQAARDAAALDRIEQILASGDPAADLPGWLTNH